MGRRWAAIALTVVTASGLFASVARGDDRVEPTAERIKSASEEYDVGRRAYVAGKFGEAAVHFENAFHDAPRPEPLRAAIHARRAAHDDARAATLASLAAIRYATDSATMDLANDVLSELSPRLLGVNLGCDPNCGIEVDGRVVSLVEAKQIVFYVSPGSHTVVATWPGDRSKQVTVSGPANVVRDLTLVAPPLATPTPPAVPPAPAPDSAPSAVSGPPPSTRPLPPLVFILGTSLTVTGVVLTVISGLSAESDPGTAAVLRDCVGQGPSCPTYQQGKSAELRTNVLLAGTGGVALVTAVIGVFFTQWSHAAPTSGASRGSLAPFASVDTRGETFGVAGSF